MRQISLYEFEPCELQDPSFIKNYSDQCRSYARRRVLGEHPFTALNYAFGLANEGHNVSALNRISAALEANPAFHDLMNSLLNASEVDELWNIKRSVQELLQIVKDPFGTNRERLGAIKELNMLAEVTITDKETGETILAPWERKHVPEADKESV